MRRSLQMLLAAALVVAAAPATGRAGGVIIHGRDFPEQQPHQLQPMEDPCDDRCQDYMVVLEHIFESRDARVSRAADALGEEVSVEMLDDPESVGVDPEFGTEGGCAAGGGSIFAAFGALALLRRRRRR